MLTKASASPQGLTKTYYYSNYTELTKMTASEYGGTTRDYTYEHDMAGRLTRQVQNVFSPNSTTTYNYEWDAADRMTKVQRVASGVTKTINYTYNAAGLRVRRVDASTSVTKLWTYAGNNIASVSTKSGGSFGDTSTQEWVYTVAPGLINNVLERHKANYAAGTTTSEYYQYDHRGNVAAVTDSTGKILRGYQYDAFGNIPFSFATGQSGAAPTDDILFTGKDLDPDTGLYYFNARWYDSDGGRYVSRTELPPSAEHPYVLCENSTITFVDTNGLLRFVYDICNHRLVGYEDIIRTDELGNDSIQEEVIFDRDCYFCGQENSEFQDNPLQCHVQGCGPLPPGRYTICDHHLPNTNKWPLTWAGEGSPPLGRGGFQIHGYGVSEGCITARNDETRDAFNEVMECGVSRGWRRVRLDVIDGRPSWMIRLLDPDPGPRLVVVRGPS
jgi:RHS repeat-associated protein